MSSASDTQQVVKEHRNWSSLNRKIVTAILKVSLVLMIVVSLLIGFLLTPWGAKAVVKTANSLVEELTIDYRSGGIGSELYLSSVKWKQAANQVDIDNLQLSIQLSCVWRLAICIHSVSSDSMVVRIQPAESSIDPESAASAFTLPFPVSIENISLNKFSLKVQDTADITWQKLTAKLDFYQRLRIQMMQIHEFNLITYASENTPLNTPLNTMAEPFDWTTWQYQAIKPLPIVLPIHFDVLAFKMSAAGLKLAGQEELKLKRVSLKAKGSSKKVQLDELLIEHQQGQLSAKGNVKLNGHFEHVFSIDASAQLLEITPLTLTLRSSGNINSLTTKIELFETALAAKTQNSSAQVKPLKLAMDFTAQPSNATLPLKLRLNWSQIAWPLVEPKIQSETGVIDISGDLNALKMTIQTLLSGQNVPETKINLNATAISTPQNKSFEVNKLLLETLGGKVLSQGRLNFSDFIDWQGNSSISHLAPSVYWPELVADINGEVTTQANNSQGIWKAKLNKLDINGQWQDYPLTMSGNIDFHENNGLQFSALSLKNAENILLLDGNVSKQQALDLKFTLDATDLSNTLPQLGGRLNLVGNLSGSSEQPEISYELSGTDLVASEVFVQQAVGKGTIKWNEKKPLDLTLQLTGIQGISNQVDSAQLVLIGDASDHQLDLTTSGQSSVNLSIHGQLNPTSWQGNWLSGDIQSSYANLTLIEPFKIEADWSKQQYFVAPHCWEDTDNKLCIKLAQFKQNTLAWDVSLKEFDVLSVVRRLMPQMPKFKQRAD
jgi:translocation and assembly module TamB